ncbi:hypothetical protein HYT17_02490 [Candidatus Microgenomates bacterium]|nr:hypothetical protein [Candidatus Microgenomates bacterium]
MNKKLLLLVILGMIASLLALTLLPAKFKTPPKQEQATVRNPVTSTPSKDARAYTSLIATLDKNTVNVGENFTITINIITGNNLVNGVELKLGYDPTLLAIDAVSQGNFFESPLEIANKNDRELGQITYAVGSFSEKEGEGTIATMSARALKTTAGKVEVLVIKPITIVTEINNKTSVLKESKGAELVVR